AAAIRNFGHLNFYQSNYPDALNNFLEALHIYEKLDQRNAVGQVYYDIARTHYMARNYEKAIEYGYITLDKYRERLEGSATVGSVRDTINVIGGLGLVYSEMGMSDKVLEIRLQILDANKRNSLGITERILYEFLIGTSYFVMGETDSAKVYFDKTLAYPDVNPSIQALKYRSLTWLGYVKYSEGEFDTAVSYLKRAFDWYREQGFFYWAMYISNELGSLYEQYNQLTTAEKYYRQSERIFREMLKEIPGTGMIR
ncbi:MAG: tetratricopeptide repeat protein, partial [Bacteroidia bacterium]|nr:tetratricopeptide repeat protein [Bacteroidia bacterium]